MRKRLYGRRKGHALGKQQASLMKSVAPVFMLDSQMALHLTGPINLEIGFGAGEHLIHRALENPTRLFIGIEPFENGMARVVEEIHRHHLKNIRLYQGDAADVLQWLPEKSIDHVDVLYPDPWPKWRQRKRRFLNATSFQSLARVVKSGGTLKIATDIDDYAAWILARVSQQKAWIWKPSHAQDWLQPWPNWPSTRYEQKARREGRPSCYLTLTRVAEC